MHIVFFSDTELIVVSRAVYMDGGFPLLWPSDANATCGYMVEWYDASCTKNCPVEWIKVAAGNNNLSIDSGIPAIISPFEKKPVIYVKI